jgi:hypothetical protein
MLASNFKKKNKVGIKPSTSKRWGVSCIVIMY